MAELEVNRRREIRKNPNQTDKIALISTSPRVWLFRLLAIGGTLSLGTTLSIDEVYAQSCRTGINITRAPEGTRALIIGKDPRTGREIVRLNYPTDKLKEGIPMDITTGRYDIEVSISTSATSRRYSAPCGQAVNIPLVESTAVTQTPRPTEVPSWALAVLTGLGGLLLGGAIGTSAWAVERNRRRNAEDQRDQLLTDLTTNEATTEAEVTTLQTELEDSQITATTRQARITQLEDSMNTAGVPIPHP